MILVDSNVIIDVLTQDATWRLWSEAALIDAANRDEIAINPIIYAEIASGFATMAALDHHLGEFRRLALPYEAGFIAGRAFVEYRRRGGVRTSPLPDFFIGAHAAVAGLTLMTRDARRYSGYFPKVELIAPDRAGLTGSSGGDHVDGRGRARPGARVIAGPPRRSARAC